MIALEQLRSRYHAPGLLAKHLGQSDKPLRPVSEYEPVRLYPQVEVEAPAAGETRLTIRLWNRGAGIGRIAVHVNGEDVTDDARGDGFTPTGADATIHVDLPLDENVVRGGKNVVGVVAYNEKGTLWSREIEVDWLVPAD